MNKNIMLRPFTEEDRLMMSQVIRSNADLYDAIVPGAFQKYADKLLDESFQFAYQVSVICYEEEPVGFVGLDEFDDCIYLVALYLIDRVQGKGIGRQVLDILIHQSKLDNKKDIALLAHKDASWAIGFYKKLGFISLYFSKENISVYNRELVDRYYLPNTILMTLSLEY